MTRDQELVIRPAERLWCTACGTVTRDMLCDCDCNRWPDGHDLKLEPNFVNYADAMQETAHKQAQQIEVLVKSLADILDASNDPYEVARAALASLKESS